MAAAQTKTAALRAASLAVRQFDNPHKRLSTDILLNTTRRELKAKVKQTPIDSVSVSKPYTVEAWLEQSHFSQEPATDSSPKLPQLSVKPMPSLEERFAALRRASAVPGRSSENRRSLQQGGGQNEVIASPKSPSPQFTPTKSFFEGDIRKEPPGELDIANLPSLEAAVGWRTYTGKEIKERIRKYLAIPANQHVTVTQGAVVVGDGFLFNTGGRAPRLEAMVPASIVVNRLKSYNDGLAENLLDGLSPRLDDVIPVRISIEGNSTFNLSYKGINLIPTAKSFSNGKLVLDESEAPQGVMTQLYENEFLQDLPKHVDPVEFAEQTGADIVEFLVLDEHLLPMPKYSWISTAPAHSIDDGDLTKGHIRRHAGQRLRVDSRCLGLWFDKWPGSKHESAESIDMRTDNVRSVVVGIILDPYIRLVNAEEAHSLDFSGKLCNKAALTIGELRREITARLSYDDKHEVRLFYGDVELRDDELSLWAMGLLSPKVAQGWEPLYIRVRARVAIKTCAGTFTLELHTENYTC
jgi:hypothetical protein